MYVLYVNRSGHHAWQRPMSRGGTLAHHLIYIKPLMASRHVQLQHAPALHSQRSTSLRGLGCPSASELPSLRKFFVWASSLLGAVLQQDRQRYLLGLFPHTTTSTATPHHYFVDSTQHSPIQ